MSALPAARRFCFRQPLPAKFASTLPSGRDGSFPLAMARRTSLSLQPSSRANSRTETGFGGADISVRTPFTPWSWAFNAPLPPVLGAGGEGPEAPGVVNGGKPWVSGLARSSRWPGRGWAASILPEIASVEPSLVGWRSHPSPRPGDALDDPLPGLPILHIAPLVAAADLPPCEPRPDDGQQAGGFQRPRCTSLGRAVRHHCHPDLQIDAAAPRSKDRARRLPSRTGGDGRDGEGDRGRTCNLWFWRPALYQLSYADRWIAGCLRTPAKAGSHRIWRGVDSEARVVHC